jgi:acetylcholinesterase
MKNNYPHLTSADTDAINSQYPLMPALPGHAAYFPSAAAAYGETTFTCVGNFISKTYAKSCSPSKVWNYRYNVQMDGYIAAGLGVPHTIDSEAIFGVGNVNDNANAEAQTGYTTYNAEIIPVVMNYYISFIRHLDPNKYKYEGAPIWESFGNGKNGGKRLMFQTNATAMEVIPQDQEARCEFWKELALVMEQ